MKHRTLHMDHLLGYCEGTGTRAALLHTQSWGSDSCAPPEKYSCYLLEQILSLPHLIIQQWTLELNAGWKIACFSKYKISISAAFASPSVSQPWSCCSSPPHSYAMEQKGKVGREGIHFPAVECLLFLALCCPRSLSFYMMFYNRNGSCWHRWVHLQIRIYISSSLTQL